MALKIGENEFVLICLRQLEANQDNLLITKATFDAKDFYDFPPDLQKMEHHKEVMVSECVLLI